MPLTSTFFDLTISVTLMQGFRNFSLESEIYPLLVSVAGISSHLGHSIGRNKQYSLAEENRSN